MANCQPFGRIGRDLIGLRRDVLGELQPLHQKADRLLLVGRIERPAHAFHIGLEHRHGRNVLPGLVHQAADDGVGVGDVAAVDPRRGETFYKPIRSYWPALPDNSLVADYAGIRPKLTGPGEPAADFMIDTPVEHGLERLGHLFGIESPGLTASLALAEAVQRELR